MEINFDKDLHYLLRVHDHVSLISSVTCSIEEYGELYHQAKEMISTGELTGLCDKKSEHWFSVSSPKSKDPLLIQCEEVYPH